MEKKTLKVTDITKERLNQLENGIVETKFLTEALAINLSILISNCLPKVPTTALEIIQNSSKAGITKKMAAAGHIILDYYENHLSELIIHNSDTIRGIVCYAIAAQNHLGLSDLLTQIKPLANDNHFGVREWAWLAMRPLIADNIEEAIDLLSPWCHEESPYLRRFASESTRPRGVWCTHIGKLKNDPQLGLPILALLKSDQHKYVQDSVGNWLNDAAKTKPNWVLEILDNWKKDINQIPNERIIKLAIRSINK